MVAGEVSGHFVRADRPIIGWRAGADSSHTDNSHDNNNVAACDAAGPAAPPKQSRNILASAPLAAAGAQIAAMVTSDE